MQEKEEILGGVSATLDVADSTNKIIGEQGEQIVSVGFSTVGYIKKTYGDDVKINNIYVLDSGDILLVSRFSAETIRLPGYRILLMHLADYLKSKNIGRIVMNKNSFIYDGISEDRANYIIEEALKGVVDFELV